jgi:hypothetical protein
MTDNLSVIEKRGKYIVTQNGQPINLPKTDGASIVTEFDNKTDAERYMGILKSLKKNKKHTHAS